MNNKTFKICMSGLLLTFSMVLPFITGQIPTIGNMLCPMHIPVLLCGFICGYKYGLIVGFISPLLRDLIFGAPIFYPIGLAMAFELASYGLISGFLYNKYNKSYVNIIIILILSMIFGRFIWCIVRYAISYIDKTNVFTFKMFIEGAFITAWPGIIIQIIVIPVIVNKVKNKG